MTDEIQMMVGRIRELGISHERILDAIYFTDRSKFVPENYRDKAYSDQPLPIGYGQTISQPYTIARMLELLIDIRGTINKKKVLEIGTGSGWETAILAKLFKEVYTIEIVPGLADKARNIFRILKMYNVKCRISDGKIGWREYAPYDAIICGANAREVPSAWVDQLAVGGRIVCPVRGVMTRGIKAKKDMVWEEHGKYDFVPLV
jgi:protein-L-isoaspartate(D-aspartate) O-methyltransferase